MGIHPLTQRRAVFLDRDGVINQTTIRAGKPYPPASRDELLLLDGVPESLQLLHEQGFLLVVVTNQPDVGRGKQSRDEVEAIHTLLRHQLPLDAIMVCYHDDPDGCLCRKPRPGMILEAAAIHGIDLQRSYLVGDRWRDIDAGHAAGCVSILVHYDYQERPPSREPEARLRSLSEAAGWIINHSSNQQTASGSPKVVRYGTELDS